jgi:hypothetical protein
MNLVGDPPVDVLTIGKLNVGSVWNSLYSHYQLQKKGFKASFEFSSTGGDCLMFFFGALNLPGFNYPSYSYTCIYLGNCWNYQAFAVLMMFYEVEYFSKGYHVVDLQGNLLASVSRSTITDGMWHSVEIELLETGSLYVAVDGQYIINISKPSSFWSSTNEDIWGVHYVTGGASGDVFVRNVAVSVPIDAQLYSEEAISNRPSSSSILSSSIIPSPSSLSGPPSPNSTFDFNSPTFNIYRDFLFINDSRL